MYKITAFLGIVSASFMLYVLYDDYGAVGFGRGFAIMGAMFMAGVMLGLDAHNDRQG